MRWGRGRGGQAADGWCCSGSGEGGGAGPPAAPGLWGGPGRAGSEAPSDGRCPGEKRRHWPVPAQLMPPLLPGKVKGGVQPYE